MNRVFINSNTFILFSCGVDNINSVYFNESEFYERKRTNTKLTEFL
jgi:hypothetical protein